MAEKKPSYGLPLACPRCDYRMLKLPGYPSHPCPNCSTDETPVKLISLRRRKGKHA